MAARESQPVVIYTDGGCIGNPGPGGWAAILLYKGHEKVLSGRFRRTTNNRMELRAAIAGLEALTEPCVVELHSDSRYLIDALTKQWIAGWKKRGWITSTKQPVKNRDLWLLLEVAAARHQMDWRWVKGHAGHAENERCDRLANEAVAMGGAMEDAGFG